MDITKSASTLNSKDINYGMCGVPSDEDYELLKKNYIKNDFPKEKIFVYTVKACDNLIDREYQCFSHNALMDITSLITAKPYIDNHIRDINGQHSRVYKAELIVDEDRKNERGENYEYVLAYCYMVNNEKNKYIIDDIMSGIRKEVSVGCKGDRAFCSICGHDVSKSNCVHEEGKKYNGKDCYIIIDGISDFYELSSVPVPCQREAGIIKSYKKERNEAVMDINKAFLMLSSLPGANSEAINVIEKCLKSNTSEKVTELSAKVEKLNKSLNESNSIIKELKDELKEEKVNRVLSKVLSELKPYNEKASEIAYNVLSDKIKEDENGEYNIDEEDINEIKNEYEFLFRGCGLNKADDEANMEPAKNTEDIETKQYENEENEEEDKDKLELSKAFGSVKGFTYSNGIKKNKAKNDCYSSILKALKTSGLSVKED